MDQLKINFIKGEVEKAIGEIKSILQPYVNVEDQDFQQIRELLKGLEDNE